MLAHDEIKTREIMKKKLVKKNPLTNTQNRLLKQSLKNLLGTGLIQNVRKEKTSSLKMFILRGALNRMIQE